ncbi:hypothetical protein SNE40_009148 [Patella caerulea]|uniref:Integrase catalytic domain-containing protein n=1 Tax=Patella caerulea TaxID=87958 RepID=A0AAN8PXS6_PATCE
MQPLRPLLKTSSVFHWLPEHDRAFEATKATLLSPPVLANFDPRRLTVLQTDASRTKGLGLALLQRDEEGHWRLIAAHSRFITETEARYAMVELELLAVRWGMKKCHTYLYGLPHFTVIVNHLPLVSILDHQTIDCVDNARIQRLKVATAPYTFTTIWKKGKDHRRFPVDEPTVDDLEEEEEIHWYVCALQRTYAIAIEREIDDLQVDTLADPILEEIRVAGKEDSEYQSLLKALNNEDNDVTVDVELRQYSKILGELTVVNDLILKGQRLLIPRSRRRDVLMRLHSSHQGIDRTLRRARQTVYWPGLTSDVRTTVEACEQCQLHLPSQTREPLERDPLPHRPFEEIAADFFSIDGNHCLAVVDRYSGWPELFEFKVPPTASALKRCLRSLFTSVGCPTRIFSDGGPQFVAEETQQFLQHWGVRHRLSTAEYPQSNGLAESAVKQLKRLLQKTGGRVSEDFCEGLLELRNTPRIGGKSPAEIVYGHPIRSRVPTHYRAFDEKWLQSMDEHDRRTAEANNRATEIYNSHSKSLAPLQIGTEVRIQNPQSKLWDRCATIISIGRSRDYRLRLPSGRCIWRNRRLLRPIKKTDEDTRGCASTCLVPPTIKDTPTLEPRRGKRVRFTPNHLDMYSI